MKRNNEFRENIKVLVMKDIVCNTYRLVIYSVMNQGHGMVFNGIFLF